jgi:hypothetical protein
VQDVTGQLRRGSSELAAEFSRDVSIGHQW